MALLHIEPLPRNATPGEVLRFVAGVGKLDGKQVGKITLLGNAARVEVPDGHAARAGRRPRRGHVPRAAGPRPVRRRRQASRLARTLRPPRPAACTWRPRPSANSSRRRAARGVAEDGTALAKLVVIEEDAGLGGRLILTFASVNRGTPLPPNRLQPGAPVVLTQTGTHRPASLRGVVSDRAERTISVAFEQPDLDLPDDATWRLDLSPDEASRQRQLAALARAGTAEGDRLAELRAVLLGEREPACDEPRASARGSSLPRLAARSRARRT